MRYYIYLSDTKIDMLFAQMPLGIRQRLAAELTIDLQFVSTTIKGKDSQQTKYSKLNLVEHYISKEIGFGSPEYPTTWFRGTLPMLWGEWNEHSTTMRNQNMFKPKHVVFFESKTKKYKFVLVGSSKHLIGNYESVTANSNYMAPFFLSSLAEHVNPPVLDENMAAAVREATLLDIPGEPQNLEFAARRLMQEGQIIIGSPLYVAISDAI